MKIIYHLLMALLFVIVTSCASYPTEQRSGKDDKASIQFVTQGKYVGRKVHVELDGTLFDAIPVKASKARLKGNLYSVATGKRKIIVKNNKGEVLYQKILLLSSQETQQITLP